MDITVTIEKLENLSIVYVSGELNAMTSGKLEEPLNGLISQGETRIILDLDDVRYISSAGLKLLLVVSKKIYGTGKFVLSRLQENVREILEMTGFTNIMEIHEDLESAKTSVSEG